MSFISDVVTAISLWERYGGAAEKLMSIFDDIESIDGGRIGDEINAVLLKHGVDMSKFVAALMPPDAGTSATGAAPAPEPVDPPSNVQPSDDRADHAHGSLMSPGI